MPDRVPDLDGTSEPERPGRSDGPGRSHHVASSDAGDDARRARTVVLALAALALVIAATTVAAGFIDDGKPTDPSTVVEGYEGGELASPQIIPKPNSGQAPDDAGDRGGWAQLTLLGVMVAAVAGIAFAIVRGTNRSRANRQQWLAAARADHDGALGEGSG